MRILGEDDVLLAVCPPDQVDRYLRATNAEVKRRADGSIRTIRLRSVGDDRSHLGEGRGRSTITTERVRNEAGFLIGPSFHVQHKTICASWRMPPKITTD